MKKSVVFAALLAGLLLVGCGTNDKKDSSNSSTSSQTTESTTVKPSTDTSKDSSSSIDKPVVPEDPEHVGSLVANYDLSSISGTFPGIYFGGKGESVDIKEYFTNTVTNPTVVLDKVMTGTEGIEKSQLAQGPKVGGIKLNGKKTDATLTFTFAEGQSVDQIYIDLGLWQNSKGDTEAFTYTINGVEQTFEAGQPHALTINYAADDMTEIKVQCTSGRPVITGIRFYNK